MSTETVDAGRVAEMAERLGFKSENDFMETAVATFLASRPDLKADIAIILYDEEEISLGRAIEISGLGRDEFKEELSNRGIERKSGNIEKSADNLEEFNK